MLRSGFSALQSACPSLTHRLPLGFADGVLSFANGNVEDLLGKLDGITRTFSHENEYATVRAAFTGYEISN